MNNDAYRLHLPEPGSDPFENLGRRCYEAQTRELIRLAEQVGLRSRVEAEDGETEQA